MNLMTKNKRKYSVPKISEKKIKPNFFFTKTLTDDYNVFGNIYIASGHSECCCGTVGA